MDRTADLVTWADDPAGGAGLDGQPSRVDGPPADVAALYEEMLLIRRVEEEIIRLYPTDKIKSPVHLSIGQEAVSVALCRALRTRDVLFATYRGHAAYLAKGGDLDRMWAELYGKASGCGKGKAGSMHLVDPAVHMMGTSAIVASSIPNAVGYALAETMLAPLEQREPAVTAVMFGEGAADEGVFHESLNFASLRRLPVLFVCENNGFAIYSPVESRLAGVGLTGRARSYGIATDKCDSGCIFEMTAVLARAADDVRLGCGPRFVEVATSRWRDHVGPGEDRHYNYRCNATLDRDMRNDQVARLAGLVSQPEAAAIAARVEQRIAAAIAFAEAAPFPADEDVFAHVFA